jgi:hypothetical protein
VSEEEKIDSYEKFTKWLEEEDIDYYGYVSPLLESSSVRESEWWRIRERVRVRRGTRTMVPFVPRMLGHVNQDHWLCLPNSEKSLVSYIPTEDYGYQDRRVLTKPGRYLTKYYSDLLNKDQIRNFAAMCEPAKFRLLLKPEEFVRAAKTGPHSCMSKDYPHTHPMAVYSEEFGMMVAERGDEIFARGLVHLPTKTFVRCYGHIAVLTEYLEANGYTKVDSWPEGASLRVITYGRGVIVPYVDGKRQVAERVGNTLRIVTPGASKGRLYKLDTPHGSAVGLALCMCCREATDVLYVFRGNPDQRRRCINCIRGYSHVLRRREEGGFRVETTCQHCPRQGGCDYYGNWHPLIREKFHTDIRVKDCSLSGYWFLSEDMVRLNSREHQRQIPKYVISSFPEIVPYLYLEETNPFRSSVEKKYFENMPTILMDGYVKALKKACPGVGTDPAIIKTAVRCEEME